MRSGRLGATTENDRAVSRLLLPDLIDLFHGLAKQVLHQSVEADSPLHGKMA